MAFVILFGEFSCIHTKNLIIYLVLYNKFGAGFEKILFLILAIFHWKWREI